MQRPWTHLSAQWAVREKNQSNKESWHKKKKPNNTAVSHLSLKYHLKTTCMLDNFLQSVPQPSYSPLCNQTIPLLILIPPNKFLHFYYIILLHAKLAKKFQGKLPNPLFKKTTSDYQIYPLCFRRSVYGCTNKPQSKISGLQGDKSSLKGIPFTQYLHWKQQSNFFVHMLFTTMTQQT